MGCGTGYVRSKAEEEGLDAQEGKGQRCLYFSSRCPFGLNRSPMVSSIRLEASWML